MRDAKEEGLITLVAFPAAVVGRQDLQPAVDRGDKCDVGAGTTGGIIDKLQSKQRVVEGAVYTRAVKNRRTGSTLPTMDTTLLRRKTKSFFRGVPSSRIHLWGIR